MKKINNPFLLSGFSGGQYFCNRKKELNFLSENLQNERNTVLYSWRRFGKTALIYNFLKSTESEKKTKTIYIDLLATRTIQDAIELIAEAVYKKFGSTKSGLNQQLLQLLGNLGIQINLDPFSGLPSLSFQFQQNKSDLNSLLSIGEFLKKRKEKIIVAIDEFQQITDYKENAEAIFRNWVQTYPEIRFIFSGSHRHLMSSMFLEKNRPFYKSAQLIELKAIELGDYENFILNHFKKAQKTISKEQITYIYNWSRSQTYTVQLICNKLYGSCTKVTDEDIELVINEIIKQEEPIYANYTKLLTDLQWNVLVAISKEEVVRFPTSHAFLSKHQLGSASSIKSALNQLIKKEIIIEENSEFKVHDILLSRWIQKL
jgi:AAA+ ATPase superfamily predicted ATPase